MNAINPPIPRPRARACFPGLLAVLLGSAALILGGCNDAQAGSLFGAGIGALAGQAIGNDTEATLIGTSIGAVAGYVIGNESDKQRYGDPGYAGNYSY